MQIAISIKDNNGLDSTVSAIFGRCPSFMFVDPETETFTIFENQAKSASGGAGIQAAQMVVDQGAESIISGNIGPKAMAVIQAAGITVYQCGEGSVREALKAYAASTLPNLSSPSTGAHSA